MSNETISIGFKLRDGAGGFKELTASAENFRNAVRQGVVEVENMKKPLVKYAAMSLGLNALSNSMASLTAQVRELTDAYAAQVEAETKVAEVMRNNMAATDAQIQSVKDLCSAQQELGVVGDEVQLAGAQELAMHLRQTESLEKLIPAMNDMIAKQYGLSATQQNAASVASVLGKAMDGNVKLLRRYGFSVSDAQEDTLKFGSESQRAAVLVDVITASVGGMNAALAETGSGRIQQCINTLGDMKESLGRLFKELAPGLIAVNALVNGVSSAIQAGKGLAIAFKAICSVSKNLWASMANVCNWIKASTPVIQRHTAAVQLLKRAQESTTTSAKRLAEAQRLVAVTSRNMWLAMGGIVALLGAITAAIVYFCRSSRDASEATESLNDSTQAYTEAAAEARVSIDNDISSLSRLMAANESTAETVDRLNRTYGEFFGAHQTAAEWYDTLTEKSQLYVAQMGLEAQAMELRRKMAAAAARQALAQAKMTQLENEGGATYEMFVMAPSSSITGMGGGSYMQEMEYPSYREARQELNSATSQYAELENQLRQVQTAMEGVRDQTGDVTGEIKVGLMTLNQVNDAISDTEKKLKATVNDEEIAQLKAYNAELTARRDLLKARLGLDSGSSGSRSTEAVNPAGSAWDFDSLDKFAARRKHLEKESQSATGAELAGLREELALLAAIQKAWETNGVLRYNYSQGTPGVQAKVEIPTDVADIDKFKPQIIPVVVPVEAEEHLQRINAALRENVDIVGTLQSAWGGFRSCVDAVTSLTSALEGNGSAWEKIAAVVDTVFQVYTSVTQVMEALGPLMTMITAITAASTAAKKKDTEATQENSQANVANGVSGAMAANAKLPVVGIAIGLAAVAAIIGVMSSLPKFASGGIVSGPTVAMVGEYPGAAGNPEVIAPLDRLRKLIRPSADLGDLRLTTELRGSHLYAVVSSYRHKISRS